MTKIKLTTMLFLALSQSVLADSNTSGMYIPTQPNTSNIQEEINQNISETEANVLACEVHLTEINKIHEQIKYKLSHFEELVVKSRLKSIRQDLKKYELELKQEMDEAKRQELREILNAIKEVNREITKDGL